MSKPSRLEPHVESMLKAAMLAPSSHNTQPWRFTVSDSQVLLYADRTRALPANDPDDRELTISCGCALMNMRVAAAHNGFSTDARTLPDRNDEDLLAVVAVENSPGPAESEATLFSAIGDRRTYRKRFQSKTVPGSVITELEAAAAAEGAWFHVLQDDGARLQAARLVEEGDAIQWANPSWRRELAQWMHPRRKGDGLTVPGLLAPAAQLVVRTFDMGNGVGARDAELAGESPVIAVLGTDGDEPAAWLATGQALERVLLTACREGLQCSYLNQPIQVAALRPKLQNLIKGRGFPQILLRLGYPVEKIAAAPRRGLADVVD